MIVSGCTQLSGWISKDTAKSKIDTASSKEQIIPPIVCGTGTALNQQTNQCIVINKNTDMQSSLNNNVPSNLQSSSSVPPSSLTPPPATNVVCRQPSGVFTQLYYRQRNFVSGFLCGDACKADVLGMFRYQGNCPADIYIEAGIPNAPQSVALLSLAPTNYFSAIQGKPSACDGNTHFNGVVFKQVQPNGVVVFELQPENYGVEGAYLIGIGAYTGCFKDNGVAMQEIKPALIGFSNNYQRTTSNNLDIDESWVQII